MFSKRAYDQHKPISHLFLSNQHPRQLVVFWYSLLKIPVFIFFLAESLILDLGPLETLGGDGMLCASFSSVSKEKDALLQCVAVYFLSRTPSLCVDTSRVGKVCQKVVHKPNEISHFTREADWISTFVWRGARQGSLLPPASAPSRSTAQSMWHDTRQASARDGDCSYAVLLYIQKILSVWCGGVDFSLGPSLNIWASF